MTERLEQIALPRRVEEALTDWARPAPTDGAFAAELARTLHRVRQTPIGSTASSLLAPPELTESEGRAQLPSFDDELLAPMQSGEHLRLEVSTLPSAPPTQQPRVSTSGRLWLLGLGTAAAAAAVLTFGLERPHSSTTTVVVTGPDQPSPVDPSLPAVAGPSTEPGPVLSVAGLDSSRIPPSQPPRSSRASTGGAGIPTPAAGLTTPEPDLSHEPAMLPAAGPATLAEQPSPGAISAALARPLARAASCLSPRPTALSVPVTVTFQANGSVQGVSISPVGLDQQQEGCLRQALLTAKTEPFARSRFEVRSTVSVPASQKPILPASKHGSVDGDPSD